MDQGTGSQENGGSKEDGLGLLFQGTRWYLIVFIITTGESRVRLMSPALSPSCSGLMAVPGPLCGSC